MLTDVINHSVKIKSLGYGLFIVYKVYNDADILEKIMTDRRRDLGPARDEDDVMSPKLKISMSLM